MDTISGIHHVKIPVADVERSSEWYRRVLGFEVVLPFMEDGVLRGVALRNPAGVQIALRHAPERAAALSGFDPLAFAVPTREGVGRWVRHLDELGETHGGAIDGHMGGAVVVGLHDPDGTEIRLYSDETATGMRMLALPGGHIGYDDSGGGTGGEGELVLLVHAGVFASWFVPLAAEPVLAGLRVLRMVRAGYTEGPAPDRHLTVADHARHCAALLDELGGRPATVVGHSSGSAIVLQLALDRPDLVRALVLSEPPLITQLVDPADEGSLQETFGPVFRAAMVSAARGDVPAAYDAFMGLVGGPAHAQVVSATLGPAGLERAIRESAFFFADEMPATAGWQFDPATAAQVRVPVLLVHGSECAPATRRLVARLAELLPDAKVAVIDGDDHLLPLRSPGELARLVAEHVQETKRSADVRRDMITI